MSDPVPNRLSQPTPSPNQLGSGPSHAPGGPRSRRRLPQPTRRQAGGASGCGTVLVIVVWLVMQSVGSIFDRANDGAGSTPAATTAAYAAGQCLDVTTYDPEAGQEVDTVDLVVVPCAGPHTGEVFAVLEMPDTPDGAYPRVVEFDQFVSPACEAAFGEYLDAPADAGFPFQWSFMFPWDEDWAAGDHSIVCYLERFDAAEWSGQAREAVARPSRAP